MVDINIQSYDNQMAIKVNEEMLDTHNAPGLKKEMELIFENYEEGDIALDLSSVRKIGDRVGYTALSFFGILCSNTGRNAYLKGASDSVKDYIREEGNPHCLAFI